VERRRGQGLESHAKRLRNDCVCRVHDTCVTKRVDPETQNERGRQPRRPCRIPPKAGMGGDYARNKQIWPRCLTRPLLAAQSTKKPVGMSATGHSRPGRASSKSGRVRYAPIATKFCIAAK